MHACMHEIMYNYSYSVRNVIYIQAALQSVQNTFRMLSMLILGIHLLRSTCKIIHK